MPTAPKSKCATCNYKKHKTKEGNCSLHKGTDNLPVMCVGEWAEDKHYYFAGYLDIVSKAMNKSWRGNINYIDLFCGPGRCVIRQTGNEVDGSPLIALKYNFAKYIFVDIEKENIKSLRQRCKNRSNYEKIKFITSDCNKAIEKIRDSIPANSLNIALIDPFGLDFKFDSYKNLTNGRKIDLIINFPLGTAIKRNVNRVNYKIAQLNEFLGGDDWQKPSIKNPTIHFINYFKKNLRKIGYQYIGGDIQIKNIKTKVPLYYLLLASKNPLGATFWKKIKKYSRTGQQALFRD